MNDFEVKILNDREIAMRMRATGEQADKAAQQYIGRLVLLLSKEVVLKKLLGQVLNVQTRTLARSIAQSQRVFMVGQTIVGRVGVSDITGPGGRAPVKYGPLHEYGFKGEVTVKEHLRRAREEGSFKLRKTSASKDFGVYRKVRGKLTGQVATVKAHTRKVNMPERSFLRTALADLVGRGVIDYEINKALSDTLGKVK